jgi:hypothetical protein
MHFMSDYQVEAIGRPGPAVVDLSGPAVSSPEPAYRS